MIGSRWCRKDYKPEMGEYVGYTVLAVTNTEHTHPNHPPQVVYRGDNGLIWSRALKDWPGSLIKEPVKYGFDDTSLQLIANTMVTKYDFVITKDNMELDSTNFGNALLDTLEDLYNVESGVHNKLMAIANTQPDVTDHDF